MNKLYYLQLYLDINPMYVFYPYIKVNNKISFLNNFWILALFRLFILIVKVNNIYLPFFS